MTRIIKQMHTEDSFDKEDLLSLTKEIGKLYLLDMIPGVHPDPDSVLPFYIIYVIDSSNGPIMDSNWLDERSLDTMVKTAV